MGEKVSAWFRVSAKAQSEKNQYPRGRHCESRGYDIVKRFELHDDSAFHGKQEPELAYLTQSWSSRMPQAGLSW